MNEDNIHKEIIKALNDKNERELSYIEYAKYIIENRSTIRDTAKHFNVSHSTVHKAITTKLSDIDPVLYFKCCDILRINKQERGKRGCDKFWKKYQKMSQKLDELGVNIDEL